METNNIIHTCKDCSNARRKNFQNTNYVDKLRTIQRNLDLEQIDKIPRQHYAAKIPFQSLEEVFNPEINRNFYINTYDESTDLTTEHMWVQIGDVNFEDKTICGILVNEPINFELPMGSIVVADFIDIEDLYLLDNN